MFLQNFKKKINFEKKKKLNFEMLKKKFQN